MISLLQEWENKCKKVDKKTIVTKLNETRLRMTNYNLDKSKWLKKLELK